MTNEEARRIRSAFCNGFEYPFGGGFIEKCDMDEINRHAELLDEALKKQIPKKPQYVDTRFRHHGRKISDGSSLDKCYKCPNCNSHIFHVFDTEKCCQYCGQALDWSDNNA